MTAKQERLEQLLETLRKDGSASIAVLAQRFDVTTMTIRRDLAELSEDGLVRVYHGVAVPEKMPEAFSHDYLLTQAENIHVREKEDIASAAVSIIEPGDILILDAGSTTALLASMIPKNIPLKIICFSLNVFMQCRGRTGSDVILAGGLYHETSRVFESPENVELIKRYRATKAFISASGIREDLGVTCSNTFEITMKQAALRSSLNKILISDSSKFGKITSCFFAGLDEFDTVITDRGIPASSAGWLADRSIRLITA